MSREAYYTDETYEHKRDEKVTCPVRFFIRAKYMEMKSIEEGRPCYQDEEIMIKLPSNDRSLAVAKAIRHLSQNEWRDYGDLYRQWKQTKENKIEGFPIESWPVLTESQKLELKALRVHTVEALANLSDQAGQPIMGFNDLQRQAKEFLGHQGQADMIAKIKADSMAEVIALKKQLAEMQAQMAAMIPPKMVK